MDKGTVYVTSESNYKQLEVKASQFGEVVYLTGKDFLNIRDSQHNDEVMWGLKQKLHGFDPKTDSIIIGQNPYMAAAVFALLGHWGIREVRVLRWDNRDCAYVPLWLQFRREVTD